MVRLNRQTIPRLYNSITEKIGAKYYDRIYRKPHVSTEQNFLHILHVTELWRQCNTICTCTSGFPDGVIFHMMV